MAEPRDTSTDVVDALATIGIQVTDAGKQRARTRLAQADAANTPERREAARARYARYTQPA